WDVPLLAVNHLEGHALSPRLTVKTEFPYLLLLVSGGHCQLVSVQGLGDYTLLGTTIDDAAGEAFDKTAKLMGLGYPGGPAIERWASRGDPRRFTLPRPLLGQSRPDFSFSGLKTAVRRALDLAVGDGPLTDRLRQDMAASFQSAVADCLTDRTAHAMALYEEGPGCPEGPGYQKEPRAAHKCLVVAGGVAANGFIRSALTALCEEKGYTLVAPPLAYCTDNAAMIALAGLERLARNALSPLDVAPRARWPLEETRLAVPLGESAA
ncbi:MAG: tRNA (adenosine(37)-N6)-threonylcarbamoyltransferase complex transferase subunit TsaD, partial [Pseudomonadota bacterium]